MSPLAAMVVLETIVCARPKRLRRTDITSEWQRCDVFPGDGLTPPHDVESSDMPVSQLGFGFCNVSGW